ncbi:MAG: SOS response-associated peptidase [Cyanobacteria bacterium SZAS LIN-2]|nr:SOS response-associated peptidase [Cyanobacteria bacterium SZAS LIN-2]
MCGRYTLAHSMEEIIEAFKVQQMLLPLEPRYNIAPSQMVPIIFTAQDGDEDARPGQRIIRAARWGFIPEWVKDIKKFPPMINARGETVAEKNSYRHAFRRRRCLVPADGFYEWQGQGKDRLPYRIELKGAPLFAFAGLYEDWTSTDGSMIRTNAIVTVGANRLLGQFHDRMPVILRRGEEDLWLDTNHENLADVQALMRPYPDSEMELYRVSKRVNGTSFNDPDLSRRLAADEPEYQAPPKEPKAAKEKTAPARAKKTDDGGVEQLKLF